MLQIRPRFGWINTSLSHSKSKAEYNSNLNAKLLLNKALAWNDAAGWKKSLSYSPVTIMSLLWTASVSSQKGVPGLSVWLCFYFSTAALLAQILWLRNWNTFLILYANNMLYLKCSSCEDISIFAVSQNTTFVKVVNHLCNLTAIELCLHLGFQL